MAADMDIPIACISRCTPMARTGWRTRVPARTCRGICCGTARPWRTTRRGSIGHRRSRETPCARRSTHRANGPGCAGATAKSRALSYPDRRTSWTPSSSEVVGSTPSSYRGIAPGRGTRDGGGGTWTTGDLADEFVSRVERFVSDGTGPIVLEHSSGARTLKAFLSFDGELLRAEGPGRPKNGKRETF